MKLIKVLLLLPLICVMACNSNSTKEKEKPKDILAENMDTTVDPAVDFFKYVNGGWIKKNPIPASEKGWSIANLVMNEIYDRMKKLSEEAGKVKAQIGTNSQKIGDFYAVGMDSAKAERQGISMLKAEFDRIDGMKSKDDLLKVIAHLQMIGVNPLYDMSIYQDEKNSEQVAIHLGQGGLGLPNRDYYLNKDARNTNIRKEYLEHMQKMFELMGDDSVFAKQNAERVMVFETSLAKASRKLEDLRDPYANYTKMNVDRLQKLNPAMKWKTTFTDMNIKNVDSVIVGQPEFYNEVENSVNSLASDVWRAYLRWHVISTFSPYLSAAFDNENFHFYKGVLSGVKTQRPRWKRVLQTQERYLGDALGQLYVQQYYSPETKKRYEDLTDKILATYKTHIQNLPWMSAATKEKALVKLASVRKKVGYPDKWRDYSSMNISRSSYVENVIQGNLWAYNYAINKLGKPVDRDEWDMTPQTYNAYYNPSNNEIVLPAAAFIIPGVPDSLADDAIIYGYAGASTIGHEITHGFDDQGRQFDEKGNLKGWWTKEDEEQFNKRAKLYIEQYNNYVVLDSMHVNGEASIGENIADLGGIAIAIDAFKQTEQYKKGEKISGLTPMQRYFMGYALGWMSQQRDESLANQIMTDVHAPAFLRVNGPMSNIPEFYEAFGVKKGDPMFRDESIRVKIW